MEKGVEFFHDTDCLRGILHSPAIESRKMGVVFLNAGLVYRTGPERLYVKAARALAEAGYSCLRFDFPGIGNSGGKLKKINFDLHSDTSCTCKAMDCLEEETGVHKIALVGMCTGARNAVWTARKDPRVHSLVLLSLPVSFDRTRTPLYEIMRSRGEERKQNRENGFRERIKATRAGRAARPVWRLIKSARYPLFKYPMNLTGSLSSLLRGEKADSVVREGIHRSCRRLLEDGRRILFVYGEDDVALVKDFRQHFLSGKDSLKNSESDICEYSHFANAGHAFSGISTQDALIKRIVGWLNRSDSPAERGSPRELLREGRT